MLLAALVDLGADVEAIDAGVSRLSLVPDGTHLNVSTVTRGAFAARRVTVCDADGAEIDRLPAEAHGGIEVASETVGTPHHHGHEHDGGEKHGEQYVDGHHHHVTLTDIRESLRVVDFDSRILARTESVFSAIAEGEGAVHGVSADEVHFHEVGAVDSIVDILGVALALELLDIERVVSGTVPVGSGGTIRSQHGTIPVPAPATLAILRNRTVQTLGIARELTTPTGAGLLAGLAVEGVMPSGRIVGTGFGAGGRDLVERANILRATIIDVPSETAQSGIEVDSVRKIEANIDDMSAESWPTVFDALFDAGALDVWITPITMKRGRPGQVIAVLATQPKADDVATCLLEQTTTIGVRSTICRRTKLSRRGVRVSTRFGDVVCKEIDRYGAIEVVPEAAEIERIAGSHDLSFTETQRKILADIDRIGK